MKQRTFTIIFALLAAILIGGCADATVSTPKAEQIICHTAIRSSTSRPIEREDTLVFSDADERQELAYQDLVFSAQYDSGELDRERALRLAVTTVGDSEPILVQLYQLPMDSGPQNQFVGGHGFTGLGYVTHPAGEAELQFWCEVG